MSSNQTITFGSGRQLTKIDYLSELLPYLDLYQKIPTIKNLLQQAIKTIAALNKGQLPHALPVMELPESVIDEIQNHVLTTYPTDATRGNALWEMLTTPLEDVDFMLRHLRDALIEYFSMYGFVSQEFIVALSDYTAGKPVLEIMAGHGYLSAGLRALQPTQTIIATDNEAWHLQPDLSSAEPVTPVEALPAVAAIKKYGAQVATVIMSWAPDTTEADWEILQLMREQAGQYDFKLLVIGEPNGATNSAKFWQKAQLTPMPSLNAVHQSFDLIDEQVYLVQ